MIRCCRLWIFWLSWNVDLSGFISSSKINQQMLCVVILWFIFLIWNLLVFSLDMIYVLLHNNKAKQLFDKYLAFTRTFPYLCWSWRFFSSCLIFVKVKIKSVIFFSCLLELWTKSSITWKLMQLTTHENKS